jgi:hypothetical protein
VGLQGKRPGLGKLLPLPRIFQYIIVSVLLQQGVSLMRGLTGAVLVLKSGEFVVWRGAAVGLPRGLSIATTL